EFAPDNRFTIGLRELPNHLEGQAEDRTIPVAQLLSRNLASCTVGKRHSRPGDFGQAGPVWEQGAVINEPHEVDEHAWVAQPLELADPQLVKPGERLGQSDVLTEYRQVWGHLGVR